MLLLRQIPKELQELNVKVSDSLNINIFEISFIVFYDNKKLWHLLHDLVHNVNELLLIVEGSLAKLVND